MCCAANYTTHAPSNSTLLENIRNGDFSEVDRNGAAWWDRARFALRPLPKGEGLRLAGDVDEKNALAPVQVAASFRRSKQI